MASELSEHVDSVHIFVTKHSGDGSTNTTAFDTGLGNYYAKMGQIQEWLGIQDQYQRNWAIRKDAEKE